MNDTTTFAAAVFGYVCPTCNWTTACAGETRPGIYAGATCPGCDMGTLAVREMCWCYAPATYVTFSDTVVPQVRVSGMNGYYTCADHVGDAFRRV